MIFVVVSLKVTEAFFSKILILCRYAIILILIFNA